MLRWWWPTTRSPAYWPAGCALLPSTDSFVAAFETLGFGLCSNGNHDASLEKIVFYVGYDGNVTHAARQLPDGEWTSKLGRLEDIRHVTPDVLRRPYGIPLVYMARSV